MQRRGFLRTLFTLAGAVAAAPVMAQPQGARRVLVQHSPLAGFHYHAAGVLWPQLRIGQPLTLVREAENTYDRRAVRVEWNGHKLGYLPRRENVAISQMLARGERLSAEIASLDQMDYHPVSLRVWLEEA